MPSSNTSSKSKPSNIIRHILNTDGHTIINSVVDRHYTTGSMNILSDQRQFMLQKVKDAGNEWFTMTKLDSQIAKRRRGIQATRAKEGTIAFLPAAGPNTTIEEEETRFGQISGETRMHLRWLYQMLGKEDRIDLQHWAYQPEYSVTMKEFRAYFKYLENSGVPVFQGLSKEARLGLQGLLRGYPSADPTIYERWAKIVKVDDVKKASAFIEHLQDVMRLKPGESQRNEAGGSSRATTHLPISALSAPSPKPSSEPSANTEPGPVPGPGLGQADSNAAHETARTEGPTAHPRSCSSSLCVPTPVGTKHEHHVVPEHTSHVSSSAKPEDLIRTEEPFRLFGNHPLRVDRVDSPHRGVRIVQTHTRVAEPQHAHTAALAAPVPVRTPVTSVCDHAAFEPSHITCIETAPAPADKPVGHEQCDASAICSVQHEGDVEESYSRADDPQRSPDTPMRSQGQPEEGPTAAAEALSKGEGESTHQLAVITQDDIVLGSDDDEEDGELMYPEVDELTDMEVDELDSDAETIVPHSDAVTTLPVTAQSLPGPSTSGTETIDVDMDDGIVRPPGPTTLEEIVYWMDKHEKPIAELLKLGDRLQALGFHN